MASPLTRPDSANEVHAKEELSTVEGSRVLCFESANGSPSERPLVTTLAKPTDNERAYSAFTLRGKWTIVVLVSFASFFSPLTANIYFPAIPTISRAFHKSTEMINLTVTMYMVFQGISPMAWGALADQIGRRPLFLLCLFLLSASCVGLALVPTDTYWLLLVLRCFQAAGSGSTVALAAGCMGDIATPAERGGFIGVSGIASLLAPAIGPVIGGVLAQTLGWRSIFWFLCIASALAFIITYLAFPETLRAIVGDGSIPPPRIYNTPLSLVKPQWLSSRDQLPQKRSIQNPFRLLTYPDVVVLLTFNGTFYAVFYGVTATISSLFATNYPYLSETDIGLVFLSVGGGMVVGSGFTGKLLDRDYRQIKAKMDTRSQQDPEKQDKDEEFPIEVARLRSTPIYLAVYVTAVVGYGWSLKSGTSIAVPLVLHFIIGYTIVALMNTAQTLLIDLIPNRGSAVTGVNNFVRCLLGAAMVSVMDLIVSAVGEGWTYVILGGLCIAVAPLIWIEVRMGPVWRRRRAIREGNSR